ncbi:MAG: hypothetical protein FWF30_00095 [Coriobacteriia bacterium]|nr:hypothetical protein [Coriobacteriia bacterium]
MRSVFSALKARLGDQNGQATVEYAIVGLILIAMIVALAAWQARIGDGTFIEHGIESASHALGQQVVGSIGDVLLY